MKAADLVIALRPLADVIGEIPVAGSALAIALKAVVEVCVVVQEVKQDQRELEALAIEEGLLCASVAQAVRGMTDAERWEKLHPINDLIHVLMDTLAFIQKLRNKYLLAPGGGEVRRLAGEARLRLRMAMHARDDAQERKELEARLASAVKRFNVELKTHHIVTDLQQRLSEAERVLSALQEEKDANKRALLAPQAAQEEEERANERALLVPQAAQGEEERANERALLALKAAQEAKQNTDAMQWLDGKLKRVDDLPFKSVAGHTSCYEDTRVDPRKEIDHWAASKDGQRVLWMSGLGGTGKSTVARSTRDSLAKQRRLLASFFFSRDAIIERSPEALIHTLVYQSAKLFPEFLADVCQTLREHPETTNESVKDQFEKLFLNPLNKLKAIPAAQPLVIVIDALDECERRDGVEGGSLLPSLLEAIHKSPIPLRLFISSRAEKTIADVLRHEQHHSLELHEIEKDIVRGDIRVYYRHRFSEILEAKGLHGSENWPSDKEIELLLDMTGFLFVYAATIARFMERTTIHPVEWLRSILRTGSASGPPFPLTLLDRLYTQVLEHAAGDELEDDDHVKSRVRDVVSALVLLQDPLTMPALARLLSDDVEQQATVVSIVERMGAILTYSDSDPVRLFHSSFADFILHRCSDPRFRIAAAGRHGEFSLRSFSLMNRCLIQNICGIDDPTMENKDVPDLANTVLKKTAEELQYACQHWNTHLAQSSPTPALLEEITAFANKHILHWIEVLSLMASLRVAVIGVPSIRDWLLKYADGETQTLFHDADHLVQANYDLISWDALQVYNTVVIFMPSCALYWQAIEQSPPRIRMLSPRRCGWSPLLQKLLDHRSVVSSMTYMVDNEHLITGSLDGSVRIWNSATLECVTTLTGYHARVYVVAYSPDERILASCGSPFGVEIWDVPARALLRTLEGGEGTQRSVTFSPDGVYVAAGSDDGTVRVWVARTGEMVRLMMGHVDWVRSVAFSPDGRRVASGSEDKTIKIWDVSSGTLCLSFPGHSFVYSVYFSPDGSRLASGWGDWTIRIWDSETGDALRKIEGHTDVVASVKFTSDGSHIFSISDDTTIRKWDTNTGTCLAVFRIPLPNTAYGVISADESRIASSSGSTVQVWDAEALQESSGGWKGHSTCVTSIAFAPNGRTFASASRDGTARIWRAETGQIIHTIWHDDDVNVATFSPDGAVLATCSDDSKIRLFETSSWQEIGLLEWPFDEYIGAVRDLAFSPDGSRIACASYSFVGVWSVATRMRLAAFEKPKRFISALAFSSDMVHVAMGWTADTPTEVWDVTSAKRVATLSTHRPHLYSLEFTSDGTRLISRCWDGNVFVDTLSFETQVGHPPAPKTNITIDNTPPSFSWQAGFRGEERAWLCFSPGARRQPKRICWFPSERRSFDGWKCRYAWHGNIVVVGSDTGVVTILDVSDGT